VLQHQVRLAQHRDFGVRQPGDVGVAQPGEDGPLPAEALLAGAAEEAGVKQFLACAA
jgi:hypothetical protein